jgi:hypothetical protein
MSSGPRFHQCSISQSKKESLLDEAFSNGTFSSKSKKHPSSADFPFISLNGGAKVFCAALTLEQLLSVYPIPAKEKHSN